MNPCSRWVRYGLPVLLLMRVGAVAAGQTLAWEPTAGPYGGTVETLYESPDGLLLAGTRTAGAFVSYDRGDTWAHTPLGAGDRWSLSFSGSNGALYAGTMFSGLYRSTDRGATWVRTGYGPARAGSLASLGSTLFATSFELRGVLMSADGGASWTRAPGVNARARAPRALAVVNDTLYMAGEANPGEYGIWQTTDIGVTWQQVNSPRWPYRYLYSSGTDAYAVKPGAMLKSADGGTTWRGMDVRWPGADLTAVAVVGDTLYMGAAGGLYRAPTEGNRPVTRIGTAVGQATNILRVAGDLLVSGFGTGLWRTRDGGEHWHRLPLGNTEIRGLAGADGVVYAGAMGAGVFRSRNDGRRWEWIGAGAGTGTHRVMAASGRTVYSQGPHGLVRSEDQGDSWTAAQVTGTPQAMLLEPRGAVLVGARGVHISGNSGVTWSLAGVWDAEVRDIARTGDGYAAAASDGVYLSNGDGTEWLPTGLSGVDTGGVHADGTILWATAATDVLRSSDAGETWVRLPFAAPKAAIEDITGANGYLYAATSSGVYGSDDMGNSWNRMGLGLPDTHVTELLAHEGILYAATSNLGVYRSAIPPPIATPTVAILSPAPAQTLPEDTTETPIRVAIPLGAIEWRWRLDTPFASSGAAGGRAGDLEGVDKLTGLASGSHTLFVTLVDGSGNVLTPEAHDSVTFHVAADMDMPLPPQRVRHAYDVPQGLSIFSPVLDGDRIRTPDVSLDVSADAGGLRASHLAAIGSTVVVDLAEGGFQTVIARDGRILYGQDFPLSGERGYVVNFRAPLTFTLEGEPYGTPIISDAVASAPGRASADVWAFAMAARVAEPWMHPQRLRVTARNLRTGERRTNAVGAGGVAVLAFVDAGREPVVTPGDTLVVDVVAEDGWVVGSWSMSVDGALLADAHAVANISVMPRKSTVLPNYPNPFNPETWIPFELAQAGDVTLTLYDATGRRIRSLDLGRQDVGYHGARTGAVRWDGRNEQGEPAASGAYVAELRIGDERSTRRIVLAR